jgi:adenylate cyclase
MYESVKDDFIFRKIDIARVKGKDEPVGLYAVYTGFSNKTAHDSQSGKTADLPIVPSLLINREVLDNFNKGLRLYNMREWETAREYFKKALEIEGQDHLSELYLERSLNFLKNPPDKNWDGTVTLTEK